MNWETLLKLALEQSAAILFGLMVVYVVQPDTREGAILLIIVVMALFNIIRQLIAWVRRREVAPPP
jgi:uncharacterized membrane protein HdeD (DUF308 family)